MHYVTVFDAGADPFRNWTFFAPGFAFVLIGAIALFKPDFLMGVLRAKRLPGPRFRWFFFLFSIFIAVFSTISIMADNMIAARDLRSGRCNVVEGKVEDFKPMPYSGHMSESFSLSGQRFSYSDFSITRGFNNTASHGGPIREGLSVRICANDGDILRLEVATDAPE